jgi:peptide/nickel transport system permease protein
MPIIAYILKKLVYGVGIMIGVISLIFFLFNVVPGDPARMVLGQRADSASVAAVRKDLGLDKPVFIQYIKYLDDLSPVSYFNAQNSKSFFYLDKSIYPSAFQICAVGQTHEIVLKFPYLRRSYQNQRNISSLIGDALPATFILALVSIIFASIVGIGLGILSALYRDKWPDRSMLFFTALGMSLPSFFAAILFGWLFAFVFGNFTGLNLTGNLYEIDNFGNGTHLMLKNLILPAFTLGIRPLSVVTQLTRNSLLDVLSQDYIRTARAKGLSQTRVVWSHALKNALNPVITSISGWFASMMAGVIFIEYIFGWKGVGYIMVNALQNFDMPVVMGAVLIISMIFVIINILVDISYSLLDPRIRLE